MHEFWFKPKTYGYGATPTTWEGWAVVAVFLVVVAVMSFMLLGRERTFAHWAAWGAVLLFATLSLTMISWAKTDGSWHWRWGSENSRNAS